LEEVSVGWPLTSRRRCPLLVLVFGLVAAGHYGHVLYAMHQVPAEDVPTVEVSLVTIEPHEIRLTDKSDQALATVTVQMFHTTLTKEQTVTLNVGNFWTDPAQGVVVSYKPASQTVRLRPAPSGVVIASVEISKIEIGTSTKATVALSASLTNPTPGIRVIHANPGLPNHQATLSVEKK
jgi:hypothetical protein